MNPALPANKRSQSDGKEFKGSQLVVQYARGSRPAPYSSMERPPPRPRRSGQRMQITGLPYETSWQVSSLYPVLATHDYNHG